MQIKPITTIRWKMTYEKQQRFTSRRFARRIPKERFLHIVCMYNITIEN
jgi:hypothetical protein